MQKHGGKILIAMLAIFLLLWAFAFAVPSWAIEYYNNSPARVGDDTLSIPFFNLDSDGSPIVFSSTDSLFFWVLNPGGKTDSYDTRIVGSAGNIFSDKSFNSAFWPISTIDGAVPREGIFKWLLQVWNDADSLITPYEGEFFLYTGHDWLNFIDSLNVTSDFSSTADTAIRLNVWADTIGASAANTYARLFKDNYFRNDSATHDIDVMWREWKRSRWPYADPMVVDKGDLFEDFEDSTEWTLSPGNTNVSDSVGYWENSAAFKEGAQGIGVFSFGGDTAILSRAITSREYHWGNFTVQVYLDSVLTVHKGFANEVQDNDTSNFDFIEFRITETNFNDNYYYKRIKSIELVSGWNPLVFSQLDQQGSPTAWHSCTFDSISFLVASCSTGTAGGISQCQVTFDEMRSNRKARAACILAFHDADPTVHTLGWPLMHEYRFPGVAWAIAARCSIGTSGMDTDELRDLQDDGWDIGWHSWSHSVEGLAYESEATQREEIYRGQSWLINNGFSKGAVFGHYPYDTYDTLTIRLMKEGFKLVFGGRKSLRHDHPDLFGTPMANYNFALPYVAFHATNMDKDDIKAVIDSVITSGGLLCLGFHTFSEAASNAYQIKDDHFEEILQYLADRSGQINVWSLTEYYEHQVTEQARLARIEADTEEITDSLDTQGWAATGGGFWTATGEDSVSVLVNALLDQLDNDSLKAVLLKLANMGLVDSSAKALTDYDPPTNTEMEARTIVAANYFDPAADEVDADVVAFEGAADAAAAIEKECNDALVDEKLDHLVAVAAGDEVADGSIIAHIVSTSEDWDKFVPADDALQAIRDRGDAEWVTSDGDTNRTTGITYAVEQAGVTLAATGSDADTGIVALKTKLTTIAGDVANIDGADGSAWVTATGFSTHSAADAVNEWETQSQADPTGFHVNLLEIKGGAQSITDLKDFADDGYDPAGDTVHTNISTSGTDSAVVSRINRRMWGIQLGKAGSSDSLTINDRTTNLERIKDGAQSATDLKDFADDGYDPSGDTTHVNVSSSTDLDSLRVRQWVWDSTSGIYGNYARVVDTSKTSVNTGDGAIPVRLYFKSVSGTDTTAVANASYQVRLSSDNKTVKHTGSADSDGLDRSTLSAGERFVYATAAGYIFDTPACTLTVPASDSLVDTLHAMPISLSGSDSTNTTAIVGYVNAMGYTVEGAIVTFSLRHDGPLEYSNTIYWPIPLSGRTDSDGKFSVNVPPTVFTTPYSGDSVFYDVEIWWDDKILRNSEVYDGVRVPDSSGAVYLHDCYGW